MNCVFSTWFGRGCWYPGLSEVFSLSQLSFPCVKELFHKCMSAFKNVRKVGKWKWSSLHSLHSSLSREEPELTLNLWMLQVELLYDFKENFICREKLFIHTYVFIKPRCQALSIYLLSKSSVLHIQIYIIIHIFAGAWGFNLNSLQHCTQLAYSSTRVKEIRSHCNLCFFLMFFFFF